MPDGLELTLAPLSIHEIWTPRKAAGIEGEGEGEGNTVEMERVWD
jgi:hypothetical protein